ncbi:MAG: thermonuclease family protein [Alphaproteobacteria bacterium]|nr:thermonuclease family protein [Alphaproteobacteria bacterium SS10]
MKAVVLAILFTVLAPSAFAAETQLAAVVERVVDGDTFDVRLTPWPGLTVDGRIRVPDIQAPETFRPDCEIERVKGEAATDWLRDRIEGKKVVLLNVEPATWAGRFTATVIDPTGADIAKALIEAGHALPWDGTGATRPDFCGE